MTAALGLPPTEALPMPSVVSSAATTTPPAAMPPATPVLPLPQGPNVLPGQRESDDLLYLAGEAQTTRPTKSASVSSRLTSGGSTTPPPTEELTKPVQGASAEGTTQRGGQSRTRADAQRAVALADPLLYLAAVSLDDLERVRIAAENRLRQLTRTEADSDGEERGFGLTADNPQVRIQQSIVDGLAAMEHGAELALKRRLRQHPLHWWIKGTVGVGEKHAARLLAAIGDPYWNTLHDRPRTVSELWAYSGYKVIPVDRPPVDAHTRSVGGEQSDGDPGHLDRDALPGAAGVAVRRKKGQRANWSSVAKMRAYLIAESCIKQARSPYRGLYEQRRAHTAITRPDWTAGHSHNDALRVVAKRVLRDLWIAARDVHAAEETS
jgi:hypothetical protein